MWMRSRELPEISKTMGHENEKHLFLVTMQKGVKRVWHVTAEWDDHLLLLNYYKGSRYSGARTIEARFEAND